MLGATMFTPPDALLTAALPIGLGLLAVFVAFRHPCRLRTS
jgi:hypothetical protein